MSNIFISYSRKDEIFARQLAESLSEAGVDVWIDVDDIPAGMKWSTAIQKGLMLCDVMIVIITPDSMNSRHVEDEWQYYLDQNKPVVPVLRKPANIHFQLNRIQRIDFYAQPYEVALQHLFLELESLHVKLAPGAITERPTGTIGRRPASIPTRTPPKPQRRLLPFIVLAVLLLGGLGVFALYALNQASVAVVVATPTATASPTDTATLAATIEPDTATPSPSLTPTVTTESTEPAATIPAVTLTVSDPVNVRSGAAVNFPRVYSLSRGEVVTVVGVNDRRDWYLIEYTNRTTSAVERGWVSEGFVTVTGDTSVLPVVDTSSVGGDDD